MALFHGLVVRLEGFFPLLHFADDERAIDDGFEAADGRAFVEREHVDRFDRHRLAVHESLRDHDSGTER